VETGIVLGTRPEIIKLAPVIHALEARGAVFRLIHTGQHYSPEMDRAFFEALELPEPDHHLRVPDEGGHAARTGRMLVGLDEVLAARPVDFMIVHGDTNSALAGALAAAKLGIPIGHVEAGLRSFDRTMPEEVNRVLVDHLSTQLYAPTREAVGWLAAEGITKNVHLTGNTIVDAVYHLRGRLPSDLLDRHGVREGGYVFLTLHRQENTDDPRRLAMIIEGLDGAARATGLPIIFSMHPRTRGRLERHGLAARLAAVPGIRVIFPPVGFVECLTFQAHAAVVATDSGGLQEEACILGVPCVTLRENTERPETLEIGANVLAGYEPERIATAFRTMAGRRGTWANPYGDGRAGARIVDLVLGAAPPVETPPPGGAG
jgi:UDP-N-acetylglucosamine 2-epimerase (non-hydrolysing)